jgi:aminopeptidase N
VTIETDGATARVRQAEGLPRPLYVLPGGDGLGYGLFVLDDATRQYLLGHVDEIPDALTRAVAWVALWENLLEGRVEPRSFLDTLARALPREPEEQNTQRVLSYKTRAFWRFLPPAERSARSPALETMLRGGLERASTASQKAAWFTAFRNVVLTPGGVEWLKRVWNRDEGIAGLTLAEQDEIAMAMELAVREVHEWQQVLQTQLERTANPDRKARFAFVMPSLAADPRVREQAFERFRDVENRRREPWVLESLAYLNHPLREAHAQRFVRPGQELLPEVQRTGDIFFPFRWSESLLSGHRSPEMAVTVRTFLDARPQLPERLRWTLLSTADELFRAAGASGAAATASR